MFPFSELITFTNPILAPQFAVALIAPDSVVALARVALDQLATAVHPPEKARPPRPQVPLEG